MSNLAQFHENALLAIDINEDGSVSITDTKDTEAAEVAYDSARVYLYITADDRASMLRYCFNTLKNAKSRVDSEEELNEYVWNTRVRLFDSRFIRKNLSRLKGRLLLQILLSKSNLSFLEKSGNKSVNSESYKASRVYAELREWAEFESGADASLFNRREFEYVFGGISDQYLTLLEDAYMRLEDLAKPKESIEYKLAYAATRCLSITGLAYKKDIDLTLDSSMREVLLAYALAAYPDAISLVCIGDSHLAAGVLGQGLCHWRKVVANSLYGYIPEYPGLSSFVSYYRSADDIKVSFAVYKSLLFNSSVVGVFPCKQFGIAIYNDRVALDCRKGISVNYTDASNVIREMRLLNSHIIASAQLGGTVSRLPSDPSAASGAWTFEDLIGVEAVFAICNSTKESSIGSEWNTTNIAKSLSVPAKTQADVDLLTRDIHYTIVDGKLVYYPCFNNTEGQYITGIASAFGVSVSGIVNSDCLLNSGVLELLTSDIETTLKYLYEPGKLRKTIMKMHSTEMDNIVDQFNLAKDAVTLDEYSADRSQALKIYQNSRMQEVSDSYKSQYNSKFPSYLILTNGQYAHVAHDSHYSKSAETRLNKVMKSLKGKDPAWFMTTWRFSYNAAESIFPRNPIDTYRIRGNAASSIIHPRRDACVMATHEVVTSGECKPIRIELPAAVIALAQVRCSTTTTYKVDNIADIIRCTIAFDGVTRHMHNTYSSKSSGYYDTNTPAKRMQVPDFSDSVFDVFLKIGGFWFTDLGDPSSQIDASLLNKIRYSNPASHTLATNSPSSLVSRLKNKQVKFIVSCKDYTPEVKFISGPLEEVNVSLLEILKMRVAIVLTVAERLYTLYGMQSIVVSQFGRAAHVQKPSSGKPYHFPHNDMMAESDVDLFHIYASYPLTKETRPTTPVGVLMSDSMGVRFNSDGIIASLGLFDSRDELHKHLLKADCSISTVTEMLATAVKLYSAYSEDNLFQNDLADEAISLIRKLFL